MEKKSTIPGPGAPGSLELENQNHKTDEETSASENKIIETGNDNIANDSEKSLKGLESTSSLSSSKKGKKKANDTLSSSFTFVSTMCGASLLSNPYTFSTLGYIFSIIAFLISSSLSVIFQLAVTKATYYLNAKTFRDIIQAVGGKAFAYTIDILNCFIGWGFLTSYIVISGSFVKSAITVFSGGTIDFSIIIIRAIITVVVLIPLGLIKNIGILGKISSFAIVAVSITFVSALVYFFMAVGRDGYICNNKFEGIGYNGKIAVYNSDELKKLIIPSGIEWWYFINAIPLIQSNYSVHMVIPNLYSELKGPDRIKHAVVKRAVIFAVLIICSIYIIMGMLISSIFGKQTSDNYLLSYLKCNDYYITVLMLIYCFILFIAFPLQLYPVRKSILTMAKLSVDTKKGFGIHCLIGIVMTGLAYLLSVFLENIVTIFGLISSLFGGFLYFFIPIFVIYKMPKIKSGSDVDKRPLEVDSNGQITVDPVSVALGTIFVTNGDHRGSINRLRSLSKAPSIAEVTTTDQSGAPARRMSLIPNITPRKYSVVVGNTVEETKNIIREGRLSIVQARPYNRKDIVTMVDIINNNQEEQVAPKLEIVARRLSLSKAIDRGINGTLPIPSEIAAQESSDNANTSANSSINNERGSMTIRVRATSLSNTKEFRNSINLISHDRRLSNILSNHINSPPIIASPNQQEKIVANTLVNNDDVDEVKNNGITDEISSSYYSYSYSEEDDNNKNHEENVEESEEDLTYNTAERRSTQHSHHRHTKRNINGEEENNNNENSDDLLDLGNPTQEFNNMKKEEANKHRKMSIFSRNDVLLELANAVTEIPASTKVFTDNAVRVPEFEPEVIDRAAEEKKMTKRGRKAGMITGIVVMACICLASFAYSLYSIITNPVF